MSDSEKPTEPVVAENATENDVAEQPAPENEEVSLFEANCDVLN